MRKRAAFLLVEMMVYGVFLCCALACLVRGVQLILYAQQRCEELVDRLQHTRAFLQLKRDCIGAYTCSGDDDSFCIAAADTTYQYQLRKKGLYRIVTSEGTRSSSYLAPPGATITYQEGCITYRVADYGIGVHVQEERCGLDM